MDKESCTEKYLRVSIASRTTNTMSKNIFELVVDGSIEDIQDLIDSNNNFDINAHDPAGNTALHLAIYLQKLDIVKYLLSKGANPTLSNLSGTIS